jgi:hypothetical protein
MPAIPKTSFFSHHIQAVSALLNHQSGSLKTKTLYGLGR